MTLILHRLTPPPFPPIEPPRTGVVFPDPRDIDGDIVAVGSDFRAGTVIDAYRHGIFPWPHDGDLVGWFSPDPRAIFPLDAPPHWSRSLRRRMRNHGFEITIDEAFADVMRACGEERKGGTWIVPELMEGYGTLHELGWAHSIEVWERHSAGSRELVGGMYGITVGGLFAGESMFHRRTDASKVAFVTMVERLKAGGFVLFDVQVMNEHLESLGCIELPRDEYLRSLEKALTEEARLTID